MHNYETDFNKFKIRYINKTQLIEPGTRFFSLNY